MTGGLLRAAQLARRQELGPAPDGPLLPRFRPLELAHALEGLLERAPFEGWSKITVHLDLVDARALARFLRGG